MSKITQTTNVGAICLKAGLLTTAPSGATTLTNVQLGTAVYAPGGVPVFPMATLAGAAPAVITVDVPVGTATVIFLPAGWPGSGCSPHFDIQLGEKSYDLLKTYHLPYTPPAGVPPCTRLVCMVQPTGNVTCNSTALTTVLPLDSHGITKAYLVIEADASTDVTVTCDLGNGAPAAVYRL